MSLRIANVMECHFQEEILNAMTVSCWHSLSGSSLLLALLKQDNLWLPAPCRGPLGKELWAAPKLCQQGISSQTGKIQLYSFVESKTPIILHTFL